MGRIWSRLSALAVAPLLISILPACGPASAPTAIVPAATSAAPTVTAISAVTQPSEEVAVPVYDARALLGLPTTVARNSHVDSIQQSLERTLQLHTPLQSTDIKGAKPLGVPDWVKAGARVTYYGAAATIVSRGEPRCKPDPNANNPYTDPQGNKYSCTGMPWDPEGSVAGDGLIQADVLAVEGTDVVVSRTLLSLDHSTGGYTPVQMGGGKVPGSAVDGLWIHPKRLAELIANNTTGLKSYTGETTVEGVKYKVVTFLSDKPGSYESYSYDRVTGLLVAATTRMSASPSALNLVPGSSATGENANLSVFRLRGYRQRRVPGVNGTNPTWVAANKQMKYSGTQTYTYSDLSDSLQQPMDYTVKIGKGGKNWNPFTYASVVHWQGVDQNGSGNGMTSSTGLFWIDPKALKGLKQGQVLDNDPQSGERLTIESVDQSGGSKLVSIRSMLPGGESLLTYDQSSGALVQYENTNTGTGITIELQLQGITK